MNVGAEQVLLIEDDLCEAKLFRRLILRESGERFLVHHAVNLEAALRKLKDPSITVVLTDLQLPDSNGVETFTKIHEARPEIPVVVLSGLQDEQLAIETVSHGAQDYLVKGRDNGPVIVRSLVYAIERKKVDEEWRSIVTARDQERRLEALGVISSGLAHEINTPLLFITTNVDFISKTYGSIREALDKCEKIVSLESAGEDVTSMISELRDHIHDPRFTYMRSQLSSVIDETKSGLSRVHKIVKAMRVFSRRSDGERTLYDVNQAVRDAVTISRNEWKDCAEVRTQLDDHLPPVPCFPEEISQAILNLLINASHAVQEMVNERKKNGDKRKGVIEIATYLNDDNNVEISIADSGGGIPDIVKPRIFEPFFTTKGVGAGTGQGLPLVRQIIVNKHSGKISFESEEGMGCVFKIELPVAVGGEAKPAASSKSIIETPFGNVETSKISHVM